MFYVFATQEWLAKLFLHTKPRGVIGSQAKKINDK